MPNYIGVVGNEHADRLAAMGTTHPTIIDVEMKLSCHGHTAPRWNPGDATEIVTFIHRTGGSTLNY
jgi:hypothetical protein